MGRNLKHLEYFDNKKGPGINWRQHSSAAQHSQWSSSLSFHLFLSDILQILFSSLPARGRGGGWGIQKIHVAFDLIKVQELTDSRKKTSAKSFVNNPKAPGRILVDFLLLVHLN